MKNSFFTFILYLFFYSYSYSQTTLTGFITNKEINSVSIILKDSINIVAYTYSNDKGYYSLTTEKKGLFSLEFSSLGYATKKISIHLDGIQKKYTINVTLKEKPFKLDEIIIQADLPMSIKKDTIRFKTKFFAKGTEQTVEELLKTIPGLNIGSNGKIKVGNQEIEKLMIDGDDFFGKSYKTLSKNMPAYPIEEVEILKHYSNNRLLKGVENSNKIALNLKLNEKSKRIWFGNIKTGVDFKNRYEFFGNLMNFGKKNKYYFLANTNNIGVDATGEIESLIHPFSFDSPASIGDNQSVRNLLSVSSASLSFKKQRTNFNKAKLVSLNAIFNPTKKIEIKPLVFLNWDTQDFFRNTVDKININTTQFTNTEDYQLKNKKNIEFGKIDFIYNISKTKMLESTTKYNEASKLGISNLNFNGTATLENLTSNTSLFDQKVTYTHKFKAKKVFLLTGRFINEKTPQIYQINQFFYQALFPTFNANNVMQKSTNQMQFVGVEGHLLDRRKNKNLFELQIGNTYRKDLLDSRFSLLKDHTVLNSPIDFQNNTVYKVNHLYVKSKYRLKIKNLAFTGKLGIHQLSNQLSNGNILKKEQPFFINPSVNFGWKINKKNKITSSYSLNTTNAGILDVYNNYVLTGFRNFSKGTGEFNQLNASSLFVNYQLGNWSDRFFANISMIQTKNFDFFSSNTLIKQNYSQTERIIIKDREFLSISSKVDYYFKKIASNLKLNLGFSKSNYKNKVNNATLREVNVENYFYGVTLRSGFNGIFNYHIGTKWTTYNIQTTISNSFTDNLSFLDVSFVFNDKFDVQLQSEKYYFGNLQKDINTYYFLDFEAKYSLKKDKISFSLSGKNLFNTKTFRTFSISDISTSTTEYRLLPRYILLKMEYRF